MTKIKPVTIQNPRGAGRKPLPEEDRKIKTSISVHLLTLEYLASRGDGVVSQGVEILVAEAKAAQLGTTKK